MRLFKINLIFVCICSGLLLTMNIARFRAAYCQSMCTKMSTLQSSRTPCPHLTTSVGLLSSYFVIVYYFSFSKTNQIEIEKKRNRGVKVSILILLILIRTPSQLRHHFNCYNLLISTFYVDTL